MSSTYQPGQVPDNPAMLPGFLRLELISLKQALEGAQPYAVLQVLHAAPDRLFAGMLIYADGTDYDPGSGVGIYRRNEANNAWLFIG